MITNFFNSGGPLILAYHSISQCRRDSLAVTPADFEAHLGWLKAHHFRSLTLAQFVSGAPDNIRKTVLITFDDGYADNHALAFPLLKRYGFVATVFLVTDYVDTDRIYSWDAPKSNGQQGAGPYQVLTWKQVHEMAKYGIEFGSHTCTHPELTTLSPDAAGEEIGRSRQDLQRQLGQKVVSFCYPRGALNSNVIKWVQNAGYGCAVVTPNRPNIPAGPYTLRRVGIYHHINPWLFRLKVNPMTRRLYERVRWGSMGSS
jgi:peptidoglycan/xylan/chitin deacetylase (PgdA/CDA1 family)